MSAPHVLPRGATPFVTPDDLDVSLKFVLQANHKYMLASLAGDEVNAKLHIQTLNNAVQDYRSLRDQADAEVQAAHRRHMPNISA